MSRADKTLFERGMPAAVDVEQIVIGAVLLDEEANGSSVLAALGVDDFSTEAHRRIYAAITAIATAQRTVDRVTVAQWLYDAGQLESVGGIAYLTTLDDGLPQIYNLDAYIAILRDKGTLRRTILACQGLMDRCFLAAGSAQDAIGDPAAWFASIGGGGRATGNLATIAEVFDKHGVSAILSPRENRAGMVRFPWGVVQDRVGGMLPGELVVLAARPGVGKSAAALEIAIGAAIDRKPSAFFSLEMRAPEIALRACAQLSGVSPTEANSRREPSLRIKLQGAAEELCTLPLMIYDDPSVTVASINAALAGREVGFVVVDYLQLMQAAGRFNNRAEAVAEISRGLKLLAMKRQVPVLALSQLNREATKRNTGPDLSHLRESGSIEQDADAVILLDQGEPDFTQPVQETSFIVRKSRGGPKGRIRMGFHGATFRLLPWGAA